jgi:serine/threonine protein kinase
MKELVCQDINSFESNIKSLEINYQNKHKNILDVYGIYVVISDEKLYFLYVLMALGEGDWENEVSKRIQAKNYYSEKELVYILKQLTSALEFLQRKNVAHRDIKLENTILFPNEDKTNNEFDKIYKICDFGEAKQRINYNTKHNTVRGTDYYMSPQLLDGFNKNQDYIKNNPHKSDVFSLGCCMIIAASLNFDVIDHIRNEKKQEEIDDIIKTYLEDHFSDKFINIVTKMIIYNEYKRIDFIELKKLIDKEY